MSSRLRKTRALKVGQKTFLDISHAGKKIDKLSHNLGGPSKIFDIKRRTVLMQRGYLTEGVSFDQCRRAPKTAQPVQHDKDATPVDVETKKPSWKTWVFSHLSEHCNLRSGRTKFRGHWSEDTTAL